MDQLRARVYTALLLGQPVDELLAGAAPHPGRTEGAGPQPAAGVSGCGLSGPGLGGSVNLTMPLSTWLGASDQPGEAAGFGPLSAEDSRALAATLAQPSRGKDAARARTRWCITLVDKAGRAVGHGCAKASPTGPGDAGWAVTVKIVKLASGNCAHHKACNGYVPSPSLRHLIEIRQRTCSFPGCRRAATRCDKDHTLAHDKGGLTCECNLSPLCRRHHRAKQASGWRLEQPQPGILTWTLPHGRKYTPAPEPYP
jgi:hypothetical protein